MSEREKRLTEAVRTFLTLWDAGVYIDPRDEIESWGVTQLREVLVADPAEIARPVVLAEEARS